LGENDPFYPGLKKVERSQAVILMPRGVQLPPESPATMALRQKEWTLVLRCYQCSRRFEVKQIPLDRIALMAQVTPCTHCSAQPIIAPQEQLETRRRLHRILDLRQDPEGK
jgi:hypothetical protein